MALLRRYIVTTGLLSMLLIIFPLVGVAQVSLAIHMGPPPPPYRFAAPPVVTVIPGTYVYAVPDIGMDIFFYSGDWYRSHEGRWFRARSYNGPWAYCPDLRVPRALAELPPDFHRIPPGHRRIPYGQLKKNWAAWERDRYWDKDRGGHEGWHGRPDERREEGREHFEGKPEREHGQGEHGHDRG